MRFTLTILAAFAAFSFTASAQSVAAKPEAPAVAPKSPAVKPPEIDTSRIWRLLSEAQALRMQASQTAEAKAADAADEAVKREQESITAQCGPAFVLGRNQDEHSPKFKDLICVAKPPETHGDSTKGK